MKTACYVDIMCGRHFFQLSDRNRWTNVSKSDWL